MISADADQQRQVAPALLRECLRIIRDEQLGSGEIPNYQCMADESWQYCFSPLISAYVYDALSCFDPLSGRFEPQALERSEGTRRLPLLRSVAHIRQRIRRFLAWQESSAGAWRFFGHGSGAPPDIDLTACAATVFLDPDPSPLSPATGRRLRDLERFCSVEGIFCSPGSRGETQTNPVLLWTANCNVLRHLALVGGDTAALERKILDAILAGAAAADDALPLRFAAGRAWRHARLASHATLANHLLPLTRAAPPSSGGALSAALTVLVLLDLGAKDEEIEPAVSLLLDRWSAARSRRLEAFCGSLSGSPALTAALTMAAIARCGSAWGPTL